MSSNKFTGIYRGVVHDNRDPLGKNRVKLRVPQVLGKQVTTWAWSVESPGVTQSTPSVGEGVWVMFEGGDPDFPLWIGSFNASPEPYIDLHYGGWYDIATQTVTTQSVGQPVLIRQTDIERGFTVTNNSRITANRTGVYNLAFSFQLHNTGGGGAGSTVEIWLTKNGLPISDSNTRVAVPTNGPYVVAAWNFFKQMNAGDYIEVYWATDNHHIQLQYNTGAMGGPTIPSAIITVNQIG